MTKKVYLVDTENVNSTWKELLPELTKNDRLILFYTANSPHISYADMGFIIQYPDSFEMMECYTGNNGLDFQLVSYLGFLLKTAAKTEYIIVSNDTGYDSVIRFWNDRERIVSRLTSAQLVKKKQSETAPSTAEPKAKSSTKSSAKSPVKDSPVPRLPAPQDANDPEELLRKAMGKNCDAEHRQWVYEMLKQYNAQQFSQIHSELQRKFGQEQGVAYYKKLRPILRKFYTLLHIPSPESDLPEQDLAPDDEEPATDPAPQLPEDDSQG
jgi:hypothetical protein